MISVPIFLFTSGVLIGPLGVYLNIDTTYVFALLAFPNCASKTYFKILRFLLTFWGSLESARSLSTILLPSMSIFSIYISCLKLLKRKFPSMKSIRVYKYLQCTMQIGYTVFQYMAGILINTGFVICVVSNWISIVGWKILPLEMYAVLEIIACVIYIVTFVALPQASKLHEYSRNILKYSWGYYHVRMGTCSKNSIERINFKIWQLSLRSLRPISFHYGLAVVDKNTKKIFFTNVVIYTINMLFLVNMK